MWTGGAWSSFTTTLTIALVSAPLTAAFGLTVAYLIDRQQFAGKRAFEFAAMLNFAVPGTVVGIAYILAFNAPPIELAYTGVILVACFVFRDMTTSMRAGLAALAQIDPSLDEASASLRAGTLTSIRRVILPLIRPAVVAALVYSFISAMTSISAVIFLTSPRFDMATVEYRRPRRSRRVRLRDGLRVGADRADDPGGDADSRSGRNASRARGTRAKGGAGNAQR